MKPELKSFMDAIINKVDELPAPPKEKDALKKLIEETFNKIDPDFAQGTIFGD